MHSPAGTNHHQAPWARAWLDCAQKSMVPQFQWEMSATPMKARVISEQDREDDGADEAGRDDGGQVRQDLEEDDPPGGLAGGPGRLHVVAASQRQGLGAQDARSPGPGGEGDDGGDQQVAGVRDEARR